MVWKIRSKTAFTFDKGTQRYVVGKFIQVNMNNANELPAILVKSDRYAPVRVAHNYRNISRAAKQFLLGDPYAEQLMVTALRTEFRWPIDNYESPIHLYKPLYRLMGDHTDRHYSLVSNNQHPFQLFIYEYLNKKYRSATEIKNAFEGKGPMTFEAAVKKRVEELIEQKLKTLDVDNGEDLTAEDIGSIHHEAMNDIRSKFNLNVRTRNKRGEVEDFLEVRRPFGQQNSKH